jgi:hypothetical protein
MAKWTAYPYETEFVFLFVVQADCYTGGAAGVWAGALAGPGLQAHFL